MKKTATRLASLAGALLVAAGLVAGWGVCLVATSPAQAQITDDRFPFLEERSRRYRQPQYRQQQQLMPDFFNPFQVPQRPHPTESTRPPAPKTPETAPSATVLVLGDNLAEWLAYGLEEAFTETPEIGIVRKNRPNVGLIRTESRTEGYDWVQAGREILATEKPNYIVIMLGLADRRSLRERQVGQPTPAPGQPGQPNQPRQTGQQPGRNQPQQQSQQQAQPPQQSQQQDAEAPPTDQPKIIAPEPTPAGPAGPAFEFRSEKWTELYTRRVDDMIAVLKTKNVPVLWIGLPSIRGTRSTADVQFLNELYRERATRAGIIYVDVWDGFVDEAGDYASQGPDFEGQTRRLRTSDGVHFTKAGARKLAHYVERELTRLMQQRPIPVALPSGGPDETQPQAARPGTPAQRPVVGPVVPLTAAPSEPEDLLGASGTRGPAADPLATRVLVRGEPVQAEPGRADDFAWPRREVAIGGPGPADPPSAARTTSQRPGATAALDPAARAKRTAPRPPTKLQPAPSWTFGPASRPGGSIFWPFFR